MTTSQRLTEAELTAAIASTQEARRIRIVSAPEAANEVTPEWLHERWSEVLDTDAEDDLMYSMQGPVTKFIVAVLFGLIAAIVLIATGTMTDPGLRPSPAASTDLRKRFAEIRASQQPAEPANVSPIQRRRNSSAKGL